MNQSQPTGEGVHDRGGLQGRQRSGLGGRKETLPRLADHQERRHYLRRAFFWDRRALLVGRRVLRALGSTRVPRVGVTKRGRRADGGGEGGRRGGGSAPTHDRKQHLEGRV